MRHTCSAVLHSSLAIMLSARFRTFMCRSTFRKTMSVGAGEHLSQHKCGQFWTRMRHDVNKWIAESSQWNHTYACIYACAQMRMYHTPRPSCAHMKCAQRWADEHAHRWECTMLFDPRIQPFFTCNIQICMHITSCVYIYIYVCRYTYICMYAGI
jgi:hypothetical protein